MAITCMGCRSLFNENKFYQKRLDKIQAALDRFDSLSETEGDGLDKIASSLDTLNEISNALREKF